MKTLIATSFIGFLFATTAFAIDGNTVLQFNHKNQQAEVLFLNENFASVSASVGVLPNISVSATYDHIASDYAIGAKYAIATDFNEILAVYGNAELEYTLGTKALTLSPTVGAMYLVTDSLSVYAEVNNTWVANQDWADNGGSVELGAKYSFNDTFFLQPSASKRFDSSDVSAGLTLGVNF